MTQNNPLFIQRIALQGFLSFGPDTSEIPLSSLNVLIGPNGSGKSNLVEAISVLRAVPKDLPMPIRQGGGVQDWLWRGAQRAEQASIEIIVEKGHVAHFKSGEPTIRYELVFGEQGGAFVVLDERVENERAADGEKEPYFYFKYKNGKPILNVNDGSRVLRREDLDATQSILSQRKDLEAYPEITRLAAALGRIKIYRSWSFGPDAQVRSTCRADVRTDTLSETFDNLPARLAVLKRDPQTKKRLLQAMSELSPGFDDIEVVPEGGQLQLYLMEGSRSIPARRLSDGTLRFLCLLAVLVDPAPPPLIAIEEPELGLHPDTFPALRDLLVEASARTQLIVTTHSPTLIDCFTEHPEAILVCEKHGASTVVSRLPPSFAESSGERGGLGERWLSGRIGGTRW